MRQYRAATTLPQQEKRLAAVCGNPFVQHMLRIELEHQGLKLHGWITTPEGARQQSDLQYCYVNGRMMRDKLINHAIRQSYETSLRADQFATYVLFIELDPHQVDVNVHPAKHEVRFHQARLVHDFIYQALSSALVQSAQVMAPTINEGAFHLPHCAEEVNPPVVPMIETTQQERVWQAVQIRQIIRAKLHVIMIGMRAIISRLGSERSVIFGWLHPRLQVLAKKDMVRHPSAKKRPRFIKP